MKNNITPKFTENLSNNIAEISKGKYTKVGIMMKRFNSRKWIWRIYTSRLIKYRNNRPIIFISKTINDRWSIKRKNANHFRWSFAYYDDDRLENIINF